jgi:hypothetical protein
MPNNWYVNSQPGPAFPGGTTVGGGGHTGGVQYRTPLDAARAAQGRVPSAEYPDGYLGTITDRHEDKLLKDVQNRLTDRSYQRGVHLGSKIGKEQYFWPAVGDIRPDMRLKVESRAEIVNGLYDVPRFTPTGNPVERLAHLGKTAGLSPPEQMKVAKQMGVSVAKNPVVIMDPTRAARMTKMLPPWRAV